MAAALFRLLAGESWCRQGNNNGSVECWVLSGDGGGDRKEDTSFGGLSMRTRLVELTRVPGTTNRQIAGNTEVGRLS